MKKILSAGIPIFMTACYIIGVVGWIFNLVLFLNLNFSAPYRAEVLRGIGVATPLGAVIGFININD